MNVQVAMCACAAACATAAAQDIKVTLLGTGCPTPVIERFGPSTLVEAGGQKFILDAGRGAIQRLRQINVRWQDVSGVFLTHLHSDHVVGFPDLWLTGWLSGPGRRAPLHVWGPRGTAKMMSHLQQAFEYDIQIRVSDDKASPDGAALRVEEIDAGVIYEQGGVKVTAFEVDHAPVTPAFGYRIDFAGRSVVFSGDTRYCENLIRHAQGTDVLIHEVVSRESLHRAGARPERVASVVGHHTTPEEAGEIFAKVKPRLAVYSHIVMPDATEAELIPPTRKVYEGALEIGEDLMVIEVGERIQVSPPAARKP